MLMILSLHSWMRPNADSSISLPFYLDQVRESICLPAVNIFVLISGYWGIKWKARGILSLIYQVYFFVFLVYVFFVCSGLVNFSIESLWHHANCLILDYWFVTAYLILYLLAPVLNSFVENTMGGVKWFLIFFFCVQTYYSIYQSSPFFTGSTTMSFVGLYILGRYIHKNDAIRRISGKYLIFGVCLLTFLETVLLVFNLKIIPSSDFARNYNSPIIIAMALCIFLMFEKISFSNKYVNIIAASSFGVYLLHMQTELKPYYISYCASLYNLPYWQHIGVLLLLFVAIFVIVMLIDYIRIQSFNFICRIVKSFRFQNNLHVN